METMYTRAPRRRRGGGAWYTMLFLLFIAAAMGVWFIYMKFIPNQHITVPDYGMEHPITFQGEIMDQGATIQNGEVMLPISALQKALGPDEPVYYEAETGSIILTTTNKVLRLKTDALTAELNQKPYELHIAAQTKDDAVYIPITPLEELYGLKTEYKSDSGIVILLQAGESIQQGKALKSKGSAIRTKTSIHSPIAEKVPKGETVRIWGEEHGWLFVQGPQGQLGYMQKSNVELASIEKVPQAAKEEAFIPWKVLGSKINLTWEAVYEKNPNPDSIGTLKGVNVVSPTWFELQDGKGTIKGKADPAYVRWAHDQGMQVWALFSNGFEPDRTTEALATADTRFKMIRQLLAFAQTYHLQGINIDFENVRTSDKANLVQFVRELTPLLHEQGLVVSIDVTPKSNSELWSLFLDRSALGRTVDYMMVMAYDEHWASSPEAGSVASLGWTASAVKRIIEEDGVSANKIILSMPLYTRIWTEQNGKVTSKAVGMDKVKEIIASKKLTPKLDEAAGQNYVEYKENGALNRIWIEDALSIQSRVKLMRELGLAGVATWNRSFQTSSIWPVIDEAINKRP
ncbi:spore germination protein YaaH [Paenibacillus sp. BK033]|nr:glycosyl hydrolase family 18 protein [Paenibacillus sp. BK033]TCM87988.1 spore germination protein YaaH [Paenibacillus sp. BK033]